MGYFANGTEGMMFEEQFCSRCIHGDAEDGTSGHCPVMTLHVLWDYDQHGKSPEARVMKEALDTLIVRGPDGMGNDCRMFHERKGAVPWQQTTLDLEMTP